MMLAVAPMLPVRAVMMAPPGAPEVASPVWLTCTQAGLELVQVNAAFEIGFPLASPAEALSWTVSPPAFSVWLEGVTAIAVAT